MRIIIKYENLRKNISSMKFVDDETTIIVINKKRVPATKQKHSTHNHTTD